MLEALSALCTAHLPVEGGGAFGSFLALFVLAGFLGSFAHCAWMCGPLVLMQTTRRLANTPAGKMTELTRLRGAALVPYHLGRITTYSMLGALAGLSGAGLIHLWQGAAPWLVLVAGLLLIVSALPKGWVKGVKVIQGRGIFATAPVPNRALTFIKGCFAAPTGLKGYVLGCLLGFLPCGLVYAALVSAAATGSVLKGAVLLASFGFSTIPALFAVALVGTITLSQIRKKMLVMARILAILAGGWLVLMAMVMWMLPKP